MLSAYYSIPGKIRKSFSLVRLPILPEDEYYCGDGIQKNAIHFYKKGKALDCLSAEEIKVEAVQ